MSFFKLNSYNEEEYKKIQKEVKLNILEANILNTKTYIIRAQEQLLTRGEKVEVLNEKSENLKDTYTIIVLIVLLSSYCLPWIFFR